VLKLGLLLLVPPDTLVGLKALSHYWESKPKEIPLAKPKIAHVFGHVVVVSTCSFLLQSNF